MSARIPNLYTSVLKGQPIDVEAMPSQSQIHPALDAIPDGVTTSAHFLREPGPEQPNHVDQSLARRAAFFGDKGKNIHAAQDSQNNSSPVSSSVTRFDYIPKDLKIESWESLRPYFEGLNQKEIRSSQDLKELIQDYSDCLAVLYEAYAWAYINQSRYTNNEEYRARYDLFNSEIMPAFEKISNEINTKIATNAFLDQLSEERYGQFKKQIRSSLELFSEKNIPLNAQLAKLESQYSQIIGGLSVKVDGKEMTIQQARALTRSGDRKLREKAWYAIHDAFKNVKPELQKLYDEMVPLRHQVALNAGFANYRDYAHKARGRYDYSVEDTHRFRDVIKNDVVPLAKELYDKQREKLGLAPGKLRPWDAHWRNMSAAPGETALNPFQTSDELKNGAVEIFSRLKPEFGENLKKMDESGLFDLESRPNKDSGGYNYPLSVTGMPFIFMNAAGTHGDVETMMHEGGHAMHTFLTANEPLVWYQDTPAEMAETASMAMEMLTMPYWDQFYDNVDDLNRARYEQLSNSIIFLPWCAVVDEIQQWAYTNPTHTAAEREAKFKELMKEYGLFEHNWDGLEDYMFNDFLMQGHIFKNPFYYIEYGIAQLGALQVYQNYVNDPEAGLQGYIDGLSLGSSKPLPEVWRAMGIDFNFSQDKIQELMSFVRSQIQGLQ